MFDILLDILNSQYTNNLEGSLISFQFPDS